MPPRTVGLIGATCLLAGWLLGSLVTPPVASLQSRPEVPAPPPAPAELPPPPEPLTEKLQIRMLEAPPPPTPERNPFQFAARAETPPLTFAPAPPEPPPPGATLIDLTPPRPRYTLAGMAESASEAGPVRTAIVSDGQTIHLLVLGDAVGPYTVTRLDALSVTLEHGETGEFLTLTLP